MAARNIHRANPEARITVFAKDFLNPDIAAQFTDCDFLFLAADSMGARLLFNSIVHQYGILGIQVGVKIPVNDSGNVEETFCVSRTITPESGCLICNGLISSKRLQNEAVSADSKRGFAYIDDPDIIAPSVVTLNTIACAHAADQFLFHITGLIHDVRENYWFRWKSQIGQMNYDFPRIGSEDCLECSLSDNSRLSRGDYWSLPTKFASD